uniref:Uncharacterized protein n=1 Tax=Sipha flava TaxID=143950 RepID=A0A2S2Q6F0_9HEMI
MFDAVQSYSALCALFRFAFVVLQLVLVKTPRLVNTWHRWKDTSQCLLLNHGVMSLMRRCVQLPFVEVVHCRCQLLSSAFLAVTLSVLVHIMLLSLASEARGACQILLPLRLSKLCDSSTLLSV